MTKTIKDARKEFISDVISRLKDSTAIFLNCSPDTDMFQNVKEHNKSFCISEINSVGKYLLTKFELTHILSMYEIYIDAIDLVENSYRMNNKINSKCLARIKDCSETFIKHLQDFSNKVFND